MSGNPLGVFTDARGLTDTEMQALAREMTGQDLLVLRASVEKIIEERGQQNESTGNKGIA